MKRAVDIGPVDAAAIRVSAGKVRLRLLFTTEQLEALLLAAKDGEEAQQDESHALSRTVTQSHARLDERRLDEDGGGGDARARAVHRTTPEQVFVIEGTKAWDAWMAHLRRSSNPTTSAVVQGQSRKGWYFPTLFPPTGPPTQPSQETESDQEHEHEGTKC